jgi:hypothetical protein
VQQQTAPAAAPAPASESGGTEVAAVQGTQPVQPVRTTSAPRSIPVTPAPAQQPEPEKKKGFFGRLKDIFK